MQIINRDYGYIEAFDCVIRGKIIMTKQEFDSMQDMRGFKASLFDLDDLNRFIETPQGTTLYNLRVTATNWIAHIFESQIASNGNRYAFLHDINYMLEVLPERPQTPPPTSITSLTLSTLLESTNTTISRHANGILKALKNKTTN